MLVYGNILAILVILCIVANIKELKKATDSVDYAKNVKLLDFNLMK